MSKTWSVKWSLNKPSPVEILCLTTPNESVSVKAPSYPSKNESESVKKCQGTRKHSSRMRTGRSSLYGGVSLSRGSLSGSALGRNMGPTRHRDYPSQKEHGTRQTGSDIIQILPRLPPPPHPWAKWLTHSCGNITLPQTSFADGKYDKQCEWVFAAVLTGAGVV